MSGRLSPRSGARVDAVAVLRFRRGGQLPGLARLAQSQGGRARALAASRSCPACSAPSRCSSPCPRSHAGSAGSPAAWGIALLPLPLVLDVYCLGWILLLPFGRGSAQKPLESPASPWPDARTTPPPRSRSAGPSGARSGCCCPTCSNTSGAWPPRSRSSPRRRSPTSAVPLVMKEVVDGLDAKTAIVAVPAALLAIYGLLRFSTTLFAELRDVVFVRVTQRAIRRVALGVFRHLHRLSLRFHLERQTGGMTRDIERGTRGISTLLSYLLFSIIPVILEFTLVGGGAAEEVRLALRRDHLRRGRGLSHLHRAGDRVADGDPAPRERARLEANTKAIDSLLNYETVKYFGNEAHEARRFESRETGRLSESRRAAPAPACRSSEQRPGGDRLDRHDGDDGARRPAAWSRAPTDRRRLRHGQRPISRSLPCRSACPGHGLPRDQAVAGGHGRHVRFAARSGPM